MFRALRRVHIVCILFSAILSAGAAPLSAGDSDPKLDALAGHLVQKLNGAKVVEERQGTPVSFLVFDFADSRGGTTQLGAHLADALSDALNNRVPGLIAIDRVKLNELFSRDRLQSTDMRADTAASWAARTLGANLAIVGIIEPLNGEFNLHVRIIDEHSKEIADAGEHLEWTEERRGWDKLPPVKPVPVPATPPAPFTNFHVGSNGIGEPVCVRCPVASYTEEARNARFSGVALIQIVIGPDGSVWQAAPVRGLPFGLTEQAVATLRTWQFQPIIGPGGKRVSVECVVEVNFQLK
ncbi:MAG TPA: energy transducer TonB [Candidatus Acidoferrales bacterium]|nr:energy transducer TonB [Candidatus Acidoferrales bacterium]